MKTKPKQQGDRLLGSLYCSKFLLELSWVDVADDLLASAALLEPEIRKVWANRRASYRARSQGQEPVRLIADRYTGPYFMLVSYAVENLFKAALVRENKQSYEQEFDEKGELPEELRDHELVKLAEKVGFRFDRYKEDLLRRLTRCAKWHGRYPVPLHYRETAGGENSKSERKRYSVSYFGGNDIERLKTLMNDLRVSLNLPTRRRDLPPCERQGPEASDA